MEGLGCHMWTCFFKQKHFNSLCSWVTYFISVVVHQGKRTTLMHVQNFHNPMHQSVKKSPKKKSLLIFMNSKGQCEINFTLGSGGVKI